MIISYSGQLDKKVFQLFFGRDALPDPIILKWMHCVTVYSIYYLISGNEWYVYLEQLDN